MRWSGYQSKAADVADWIVMGVALVFGVTGVVLGAIGAVR